MVGTLRQMVAVFGVDVSLHCRLILSILVGIVLTVVNGSLCSKAVDQNAIQATAANSLILS
jgi:hypothetical protein